MTKFMPATIPSSEVIGTALGWLELWKKGDLNTMRVVGECSSPDVALSRLTAFVVESMAGNVFLNDTYQVVRRDIGNGMIHLSIKRLDKSAEHDWRDYQKIKNELVGPECEGVELYPAESRLVDNANQWHIWCFKDPDMRFPIGWQSRMVSDHAIGNGQQRPF